MNQKHEKTNARTSNRVHRFDQRSSEPSEFEGVMLDNGAAGTPSGLPAYLNYCTFTGIEPKLHPSNNKFVGVGKVVTPSLGSAIIRMPIGENLLDFRTDIVQHDIPLMFGLDQHKVHGCSSDEYKNTFTHHPTATTIPVSYKRGHLWIE